MEVYDSEKTDVEARQGSRRLGNFWVLIISTAVVVALFAIIFLVFALNTPPSAA
jgi:succinate dehydrogenase hydrophobic anchor subunit